MVFINLAKSRVHLRQLSPDAASPWLEGIGVWGKQNLRDGHQEWDMRSLPQLS